VLAVLEAAEALASDVYQHARAEFQNAVVLGPRPALA
jgi:hypothetical protein